MKHHEHHDLIIAFAKGATIQYRVKGKPDMTWDIAPSPSWSACLEYRIKPSPAREMSVEIVELREQLADSEQALKKCMMDKQSIICLLTDVKEKLSESQRSCKIAKEDNVFLTRTLNAMISTRNEKAER